VKIKHTAALVLASTWLLLVPPNEKRAFGQFRVMIEPPLSQWSTIGTFPTKADCEGALQWYRINEDAGTETRDDTKTYLTNPDPDSRSIAAGKAVVVNGTWYKRSSRPPEGPKCVSADELSRNRN
jgi:hypothetical protein